MLIRKNLFSFVMIALAFSLVGVANSADREGYLRSNKYLDHARLCPVSQEPGFQDFVERIGNKLVLNFAELLRARAIDFFEDSLGWGESDGPISSNGEVHYEISVSAKSSHGNKLYFGDLVYPIDGLAVEIKPQAYVKRNTDGSVASFFCSYTASISNLDILHSLFIYNSDDDIFMRLNDEERYLMLNLPELNDLFTFDTTVRTAPLSSFVRGQNENWNGPAGGPEGQ